MVANSAMARMAVCVLLLLRVDLHSAGLVVQLGGEDVTASRELIPDEALAFISTAAETSQAMQQSQPSNSSAASNSSAPAQQPDLAKKAEQEKAGLENKVMMALSASQGQTKVHSALENAKRAVVAAKEAASQAMSLADTPSEKQAALAQVAIAKRLMTAYKEQHTKYNPFAATDKSSDTFGQMEQDAEQAEVAQEQKAAADKYTSKLAKDSLEQKKRREEYEKSLQPQPSIPPPLQTREPATYTKEQVDILIEKAKKEKDDEYAIKIKQLNDQWAARQATAISNAVREEKEKATSVVKATEEKSEKKIALMESKRRLEAQKAALQLEKVRLTTVQHAAATAALTASLNAKEEADKITRQADILAAQETRDVQVASAAGMPSAVSSAPGIANTSNASNGTQTGGGSPQPSDATHLAKALPAAAAGEPTDVSALDVDSELRHANQKKEEAFEKLTSAMSLQVRSTYAHKYAYKAHHEAQAMQRRADAMPASGLVAKYQQARQELASSTADERNAKADAKSSITVNMPTSASAVLALRTAHARAVGITTEMKTHADTAVRESAQAVNDAKSQAKEAFEKASAISYQRQHAEDMRKATQALQTESAAAAAQRRDQARAKADLLKTQAQSAVQTALNIQNATVQSKQDELATTQQAMLKAISDEKGAKAAAKAATEEEIAAMPPV